MGFSPSAHARIRKSQIAATKASNTEKFRVSRQDREWRWRDVWCL